VKYAWIARHKKHWPVSLACDVLGVSTSGFFENMRRQGIDQPSKPGANKRISNEALLAHIRAIHVEVKQEYGWPKMWKELVARGIRVGKERVRRMMQEHGIKARGKRKFVVTTDSKHKLPIAANLLQRNFTAAAPNQVWTGDITYIATDEGWLYLAVVLDLFSRQVVGWSMQPHMQSSLVTDALRMAWFRRAPEKGVIFHCDRGSQGAFNRSSQHLQLGGVYGKTSRMDEATDRERHDALSRSSFASARDRASVLGTDCDRNHQ
jgi:transposase InsO family protein